MIVDFQKMFGVMYQTEEGDPAPCKERPARAVLSEMETPRPGPGELLIKVDAAGINMADILQRQGRYPAPEGASEVPGLEVSGTIAKLGTDVSGWEPGQPVCALLSGGGYAEYVKVDSRHVLPLPSTTSPEEAAGLVEVAATCWANLFMHADTRQGDWVLIHGGSGGIGSFAIQLLSALGIQVITTAGSDEKARRCNELGASRAVNYRRENFAEVVKEVTEGHGADVILDVMGGAYLRENVRALARGGRLVVIGTQGGREGTLSIGELMAKRAWVTGSTLRARDAAEKATIIAAVGEHIWPLLEVGQINPNISHSFGINDVEEAHRVFQDPGRVGKVVLTMRETGQ